MDKRLLLPPAVIAVFILYFTVFGDRGLLRIHHLNRDRDDIQQRLTDLKGENDKLKREIAALQSDKRYLESIARRDFGLVRSNETIYQFPTQQKPQGNAAAPAPPTNGDAKAQAKPEAKAAAKTPVKVEGKGRAIAEAKAPGKPVATHGATADAKEAAKAERKRQAPHDPSAQSKAPAAH